MSPARRTRRVARRSTRIDRGGAEYTQSAAPKKNSTNLIIGGSVGGFIFLLVIIIALSSGSDRPYGTVTDVKDSTPRKITVDVSALEREGFAKCEEGYAIVQQCEGMMDGRKLTASEQSTLKERLERGMRLIQGGLSKLEEAYIKTNYENKYDTNRFQKAQRAARYKLGELGGR